jgi:signal transduction histidine kinase
VFLPLVARRDPLPGWMLSTDVGVTAVAVAALPWAARTAAFVGGVAIPDFEAVMVSVAVTVALVTGSIRATAAGCLTLAGAYALAQIPAAGGGADIASTLNVIGWQVATAACAAVLIRRLRAVAWAVDSATERVIVAREGLAARRTQAEERMRHFHEQLRRHRALHDGPLRLLTAIAGPGPAAHPDPAVRRSAAISANVLRGATPDHPDGTLTDLSLALVEAGNDSASHGLRVEYHFANLADTLPPEVVEAFRHASAEALANVANHSGTTRARLTALTDSRTSTVTVAIVDQGKGFDPEVTEPGYGIRHSIRARMAEVGGVATVDSHPGHGTRVDLQWPG